MNLNRLLFNVLFIFFFALNSSFALAEPADKLISPDMIDKATSEGSIRIIVKLAASFQPEGTLASVNEVETQQNNINVAQKTLLQRLSGYTYSNVKQFQTIPFIALEVDAETLDALLQDPEVITIQEDVPVPPTLNQSIPFINADDLHSQGITGSGYAVAVLDTGVMKTHEFLDSGKVVSEACYSTTDAGYNSTTLCPNGTGQQTGSGAGVNCDLSIDSGCSHGTHVAGIAAGIDGSPGTGVAPGADVIAIQVFSRFDNDDVCGAGNSPCVLTFTTDQMLGLERVYALRNTYDIAAANMSLGGGGSSSHCDGDSRKPIIDNLRSAGIATVISSGNNGWNGAVGYPGCISSAITVGATLNDSNAVAGYSNHATIVDLMAPGSSINSSIATSTSSYASWNGTSMAAPHVAGAFAVMKNKNSNWSITEIENLLENTGEDSTRSGITVPRIDLLAAAGAILDLDLDHFISYKAKTTPKTVKFEPSTASLNDMFEDKSFDVKKMESLANPAARQLDDIDDPDSHLVGYMIKETKGETKHQKQTGVLVTNDLGTLVVDTKKPDGLFVPSAKGLDAPVEPLDPVNIDHFKCYTVVVKKKVCEDDPTVKCKSDDDCGTGSCTMGFPRGVQRDYVDQFEQPKLFDIKNPTRLCVPVDVDDGGIIDEEISLMCYKAKKARKQPKHVKVEGIYVNNQFAIDQLEPGANWMVNTIKEEEICVPSLLGPVEE